MNDRVPGDPSQFATALAARGRVHEGYNLLERAILGGDGVAAATLADWRMAGEFIRRDLSEARRLYGQALALGLSEAAGPFVALLASGAGDGRRDWRGALKCLSDQSVRQAPARAQLSLIKAMDLTFDGDPRTTPSRQRLSVEPDIDHVPGFLTPGECGYLRQLAAGRLAPALIVDPRSGALRPDPVRVASTAAFPFVDEDPVLHAINRRIAAATGTEWVQAEPAQVLAYRPGEEYRLHSDALPAGSNQRIMTFLVALNDDYEGGETNFPAIGLQWRGRTGDALMFRNVGSGGLPVPSAKHAGNPVRRGNKFILSRWIRQHALDLSGPPGKPF